MFPFHFVVDRDLTLVQVGPALVRWHASLGPGAKMEAVMRLQRPALSFTFRRLAAEAAGEPFVFEVVPRRGLVLRGQMVALTEGDALMFLGGPVVRDTAECQELGLEARDFAVHDSTLEFLAQADQQKASLDQAQGLAMRLASQQADLRRTTVLQQAVLDGTRYLIISTDERGVVQFFNVGAEQLLGYTESALAGLHSIEVLLDHVELKARADQLSEQLGRTVLAGVDAVTALAREGLADDREWTFIRRNGAPLPVQASITPLRAPDGVLTGFLIVGNDVTQRKLAEQEVRKLAMVAGRTDNAVIIADAEGRVEWINEGFTRLTGYSLAECVGRRPGKLLQGPETDPATVQLIRDKLKQAQPVRAELLNYRRDAQKYWVQLEIQPIRDERGRVTNFIAVESDVTERRRAAEELRQAKETAELASKAKGDFLAVMSHEIRTPLNGVVGFAHLLGSSRLEWQQREFVDGIRSSAEALLALINDILDFSKVESGRIELECVAFDLRRCVESVMDLFAGSAAGKRIELVVELGEVVPERVFGDQVRLRQVLINLVGNAVKFTEAGEVVVRIVGAGTADRLRVEVQDSGIGIPADRVDRLFRPFTQADSSTTRKYGGTGLGLAISKRLVEVMGGEIGVDSVAGRGSTFWFELALKSADKGIPSRLEGQELLFGRRLVMVKVPGAGQRALERQLLSWGMSVTSVPGEAEAVALLRRTGSLDLVLADLDGMPGQETAYIDRLRTAVGGGSVRWLGLCAVATAATDSSPHRWGCDALAFKPIRQTQLLKALLGALGLAPAPAAEPLPVVAPAVVEGSALDSAPEKESPADDGKLRILVAEDFPMNQRIVRLMLQSMGYQPVLVGTGGDAVEAVKQEAFDLVLMDMHMPGMDGMEATAMIRKLAAAGELRHPAPAIVALTADAMQGDRERFIAAGMDDYLSKPLQPDQLTAVLRRYQEVRNEAKA